jgi:hypothetical protein
MENLIPQLLRPTRKIRETILVFPNLLVNEVGAKCIELCDGEHTIGQIVDAILTNYKVLDREIVKNDVILFFSKLKELGVIKWKEKP